MRSEVIGTFQNVLNELGNSAHKVPVLELPSTTDEIKKIMDEKTFDEQIKARGLSIVGFVVESVTLDEASNKKIDKYELSANTRMQQGTLVGSFGEAVKDAAKNEGGAANGFMGIGMMNMASGGIMGGAVSNAFNNNNAAPAAGGAFCPKCGAQIPADANFCTKCGAKLQ
ncbi:MAG: zinc-ribbon domain-containing protein, partial [Bacilli bacterium]|nr:zinc-ribbon domain-containing protein [Bacilli bacterium]